MKRLFIILIFFCLFMSQNLWAQIDLNQKLVPDSKIVVGNLPNGITYYLRHNEEPKERASFYIIRNAGALLEEDNQNGLAHFLEHMAFQGTKNFPGKGIVSGLEKHGVAFGQNINAYTTHNETVYNLSSVPTTNESLIDTCLLVLHDWSYYLTLEDKEIDDERGVITEEWRTRRTPAFRIQAQTRPIQLKGSKYAVRDVIGSLDVIKNFKYQTIRDFYHKWYRTDLEAIAIVGDIDVKVIEEKIKVLFSTIPQVENPEERPFFTIPDEEETNYVLATDKEVSATSINMATRFRDFPVEQRNTVAYMKEILLSSFYNNMINARISELMQQENPPFMGASIGFGKSVRGYLAHTINVSPKPNEEAIAWEAILRENERVIRYGFTDSELERVKTNMLVGLESAYKQKDKVNNESYINDIKNNFLEQTVILDFEAYYQLMKRLIPSIKVEEVSAKAKEWNVTKNRTITISGPSIGEHFLTKDEVLAIWNKVSDTPDIQVYEDKGSHVILINEELKGGKIVSTRKLPRFNATEWTLDNGARIVFRKADYDKENVSLTSYSKGGTSLYDIDMLAAAENTAALVGSFGLGDYDPVTLRKILTGKTAGSSVSIGGLSESVNGTSTPKDMETIFQLVYLNFEKPRFDPVLFTSVMNRNRLGIPQMKDKPQKMMQDSIKKIFGNYHPRILLFDEAYLDQITLEKLETVYRDRIKDASDFIFFIVGNVEEDEVLPLVKKYLGSLKSEYRKETWRDNHVRRPKGKVEKRIQLNLETPKTTIITSFSKDLKYSVYNSICNSVMEGILQLRYTKNIREKEGGTYGVSVNSSVSRLPYAACTMTMQFDCDPEKAEFLKSLVYAETEEMMKKAPTKEEMEKVISNIRKNNEQSKNHNSYWMSAISTYYIEGIDLTDPKKFGDILDRLKPKDIQHFAKKLLKEADVIDITFEPRK